MVKLAEAKGIPKRRLERAMERLFAAGIIKAGMPIGTKANRHPLVGIGRAEVVSYPAPEFVSECARVAPEFEPDFAETAPEACAKPSNGAGFRACARVRAGVCARVRRSCARPL